MVEQTHEYVLCGIYGELNSHEGELPALVQIQLSTFQRENIMKEKIDLSLNRSLEELESSYWEFVEATEGEDSSGWSKSVQEDISALEGYLMKMEIL